MFYLDEDSEDEEEKAPEGVYHGKAPAGILVSDIHQHTTTPTHPPPQHQPGTCCEKGAGQGAHQGKQWYLSLEGVASEWLSY